MTTKKYSEEEEAALLEQANQLLQHRNRASTKYLRERMTITGHKAGDLFRKLEWQWVSTGHNRTQYRRGSV